MQILIISDTYFPSNNSAAVLLHDLTIAFARKSISVKILVPSSSQKERLLVKVIDGCEVISLKTLKTKDVNLIYRTFSEIINPMLIASALIKSNIFANQKFNLLIWYSPSIFWGPLISYLKSKLGCKTYLILRDIFPEWALSLGLLKKGPIYYLFKYFERYQYRQADCIAVQSPNNLGYFNHLEGCGSKKNVVLWNWATSIASLVDAPSSIKIRETILRDKFVFIYAGNLGIAQDVNKLIRLMVNSQSLESVGFLIVGRGSEFNGLKKFVNEAELKNILMHDEIPQEEIPNLFSQCHAGLIFLDHRHTTHSIPGKFVSYMRSGIPVLASINPENDLLALIEENNLGYAYCGNNDYELYKKFLLLLEDLKSNKDLKINCKRIFTEYFSVDKAAWQILEFIESNKVTA
jgi:glycosyltransferase involved in cell wall biosynthesis